MAYFPVVEYITVFAALYAAVFYFLLLLGYSKQIHTEPVLLSDKALPSVSIVIPVLNEAGTISQTLNSVLALKYPKNKLEVIVVDDESTDNTVKEVQWFASKRGIKELKLIRNKHVGVGKSSALNTGIRSATGELVATLDSDSFPEKTSLVKLASFFADPFTMAVTAAVKVYSPKTMLEKIQGVEYIFVAFTRRLLSFVDSVTVTPGPFSVFRRDVFNKVGLFDENNLLEDQEMAYRIQSHNYKIVGSLDAEVYTQVPSTFSQLMRQRIRWNRGGIRNFYKHRKLLNPKYGELGAFILPLGVLTIFLVIAVFATLAWQIISGQFFSWFSIEAFIYSFGPLQVISLLTLLVGIVWVLVGRRVFETEHATLSMSRLFLFLFVYTYFMTVFWLATFGEEVFHKKQKW
ncbi:MAG: glycosyltransferase family 2 protein [Candidatus Micrarchaeota archaeon]|nr:glycosyltransferase family 2 protein [Candidatus Micrarchaeota archaeon]